MIAVILAGVWLASLVALASGHAWAEVLSGAGAVAVPVLVMRGRRGLFVAMAALGVSGLAWVRWQAATAPPAATNVAWWADGGRRAIVGRIIEPPEPRGSTLRFRVDVQRIETQAGPVAADGALLVRVSAARPYRAGDLVRLDGRLEAPPALPTFDYPAYLARRGVYAVMEFPRVRVTGRAPAHGPQAWVEQARMRSHDALWRGLPAAEAALGEGILVGRRAEIPRALMDDFNRAGVSHLIVISGFNIALLGGFVMSATAWLIGRRRAGLAALAVIGAYCAFVGWSPPVARAALMGSIAVLALLSGRPHGSGTALLFAAAALTAQDPRIVLDLSFQLSFAATAGLLLLAPAPQRWGRRLFAEPTATGEPTWRSAAVAVWDTLAITLAATAATLPLLLLNFERLSLVSPLANLLLAPLFPLVLVLGGVGLAVACVAPAVAGAALLPLGLLLETAGAMAHLCAHLPGATLTIRGFTTTHAVIVYAVLGFTVIGRRPGRAPALPTPDLHVPAPLLARPAPVLAMAPAALLLLAAGSLVVRDRNTPDNTRVDVFGLPGSAAALVTLPGGARVLVDTGLTPTAIRPLLDGSPVGGHGRLSAVVVTRDAPSAVGGLATVIERYGVDLLLIPPEAVADDARWLEPARARGITVEALRPGQTFGNDRARLAFAPPARHGDRWSLAVEHGHRRIAVSGSAGDAGVDHERAGTTVYMAAGDLRLQARLATGDAARITSDGTRVRLRLPRGRRPELRRCETSSGQRAAGTEQNRSPLVARCPLPAAR